MKSMKSWAVLAGVVMVLVGAGGAFADTVVGDVNIDGTVTLTDAVMVLQLLAGKDVDGINLGADPSQDGQFGVNDTIWLLQAVAGLRRVTNDWIGTWNGGFTHPKPGIGYITDWVLYDNGTMRGNWEFIAETGSSISWDIDGNYSDSNNQINFTVSGTADFRDTSGYTGSSGYTLTVTGALTSSGGASGLYAIFFTNPLLSEYDTNSATWTVTKSD